MHGMDERNLPSRSGLATTWARYGVLSAVISLIAMIPLPGQIVTSVEGDRVALGWGSSRGVAAGMRAYVKRLCGLGGAVVNAGHTSEPTPLHDVDTLPAIRKVVLRSAAHPARTGELKVGISGGVSHAETSSFPLSAAVENRAKEAMAAQREACSGSAGAAWNPVLPEADPFSAVNRIDSQV